MYNNSESLSIKITPLFNTTETVRKTIKENTSYEFTNLVFFELWISDSHYEKMSNMYLSVNHFPNEALSNEIHSK